jgi:hypothetical protein
LKESIASIIGVKRISEEKTMLAVSYHADSFHPDIVGDVPPKHQFLQQPQGVTSQKMAFFIVTTVKSSNLTSFKGDGSQNCITEVTLF